jgi:hypothetical protein
MMMVLAVLVLAVEALLQQQLSLAASVWWKCFWKA